MATWGSPGVTSRSWGQSWWVTSCYSLWHRLKAYESFVFAQFSLLSGHISSCAWWLGTQRRKPQRKRRLICREEDGAFLGGGCLEEVLCEHHLLVETNQRKLERVQCTWSWESLVLSREQRGAQSGGVGRAGPWSEASFPVPDLEWGQFLLIYLVPTSSREEKSSLCPTWGRSPSLLRSSISGLAPRNLCEPFSWFFEDSSSPYSFPLEWAILLHFGLGFVWLCRSCFFLLLLLPEALFPKAFLVGCFPISSESAHLIVCPPCFPAQPSYFFTPLPFTWPQLRAVSYGRRC